MEKCVIDIWCYIFVKGFSDVFPLIINRAEIIIVFVKKWICLSIENL